jgi:hypothetical protein
VNEAALQEREADLEREAGEVVAGLHLSDVLGRAGRVVPLGSAVTGLMVWRDLDFGVDAPGLTPEAAWETMHPLLVRCSSLRYVQDDDDGRHYFVLHIGGWKIDVSLWPAGMPPEVEALQAELIGRLTDSLRIALLRLKTAWCSLPVYPEIVSAWQIYDAVLNHEVRTLDELDLYLDARGFPTSAGSRL